MNNLVVIQAKPVDEEETPAETPAETHHETPAPAETHDETPAPAETHDNTPSPAPDVTTVAAPTVITAAPTTKKPWTDKIADGKRILACN